MIFLLIGIDDCVVFFLFGFFIILIVFFFCFVRNFCWNISKLFLDFFGFGCGIIFILKNCCFMLYYGSYYF